MDGARRAREKNPPCEGKESDAKTVLRDVSRAAARAKKPSSFCFFPDRVSTQSSLNLSECLEIIE